MKSNEHRKNERHAHPTLGIDVITRSNGHAFGNVMERDSACDDHTSNPEFAFGRMLFQVLIVMIDMAQFIDVVMGLWMQAARSVRHLALRAFIDQPIQEEYHRHAHKDRNAYDKDCPI